MHCHSMSFKLMQAKIADPIHETHTIEFIIAARQVHQEVDVSHPEQVAQARSRTR